MADPGRAAGTRVAAAFAAIYLIWGSTFLAIRYAIETIPPLSMAALRFLLAGGALYLWTRARGAPRPAPRHWRWAFLLGGLLLLGGNGSVSWAEQRVASGTAALIVATIPLWMALFGIARGGARPDATTGAGLLLGLGGVALLVGPAGFGSADRVDPAGAAVLLGGALLWSIGSLLAPRATLPPSHAQATGMEMIAGGLLLAAAGAAAGEWARLDPAAASWRSLGALAYLAVAGSIVAFTAYKWLLGVCPPARVATYAFVNPIVAVFLGWALAGEALGTRTLVAAAVIVAAVALIIVRRSGKPAREARPSTLDGAPLAANRRTP